MRLRKIGGRSRPEFGGEYRFSGRTLSAPTNSAGLYATPVGFRILLEDGAALLAEGGDALLLE